MPESAAPTNAQAVAPATQTQTQPGGTTAPPGAPTPPPEGASDDVKTRYVALEKEHQKKVREYIVERSKWDGGRKTRGDKLSKLGEYEKREQMARTRPIEFLKTTYGDKWQETLRELLVSGVAPGEMIQGEVERRRGDFQKQLEERDAAAKRQAEEAAKAQEMAARREVLRSAAEYYKASEKEYPVFKRLGSPERVAAVIAQRIESEFWATAKKSETGEGRILSPKEAADLIETEILGYVEEAASHEKYKPKFLEKLQPAKPGGTMPQGAQAAPTQKPQVVQQQSPEQQPRRTLSNNLTGSTQNQTPAMTDAERRERALSARQAFRGKAS